MVKVYSCITRKYLLVIIYRRILIHIAESACPFSSSAPKLPDMDQWPTSILRTNDGMAIFIGWEDEDILITWVSQVNRPPGLSQNKMLHLAAHKQRERGFRHVERKKWHMQTKTRKLKPGSQKKAFDVKFQDLRVWPVKLEPWGASAAFKCSKADLSGISPFVFEKATK